MRPRVCIIQPVMKQYRLPFFLRLREQLAGAGIDLQVVYGTPWAEERERGDHAELPFPWGQKVESRMLFGKLFWMPVFMPWATADLVVVEHANKHVLNYPLAVLARLGLKRMAYWGHGRDRQTRPDSWGERYKRRSLHWADWWFAYTEDAAAYVADQGYSQTRITVVQNAVDTRELRETLAAVTDAERAALTHTLGWAADSQVAIYCGSLYENKRLDWLMAAADAVHARHPDFCLLIVGGGPLADRVREYTEARPWVHAAGPRFGRDKAVLLSLACLWLNPGLVGLGVLDAFCASLPFLTTRIEGHGPELTYLQHEGNCLISEPNPNAFAEAIESLLNNPERLARMRSEAEAASHRYSIEAMVDNFAQGVKTCLSQS